MITQTKYPKTLCTPTGRYIRKKVANDALNQSETLSKYGHFLMDNLVTFKTVNSTALQD